MYSNAELLKVAQETFAGAKLIEMLKQNIREEGARSAGTQGKQKIIDRLVKKADNQRLAMAHKQKDGRYVFTDGSILFFADTDCGYKEAEIPFNALRVIESLDCTDSVTLDKAEIQQFCKLNGLRRGGIKRAPYIVKTDGGQYIGFNPFYLIDMIDYTGSAELAIKNPKTPAKAIDDSIVCPVNIDKDFDEEKYQTWRANNL